MNKDYQRHRNYYLKNREKINVRNRARRKQNPSKDKEYGLVYRQKFVWRRLLVDARKRAAMLHVAFDLDDHLEEFKRRVEPMICELTGVDLVSGVGAGTQGKRFWNTASLDRKVPAQGYTLDNIRIVCWAMNAAMGTWGEETLYAVVTSWIRKRTGERIAGENAPIPQSQDAVIAFRIV